MSTRSTHPTTRNNKRRKTAGQPPSQITVRSQGRSRAQDIGPDMPNALYDPDYLTAPAIVSSASEHIAGDVEGAKSSSVSDHIGGDDTFAMPHHGVEMQACGTDLFMETHSDSSTTTRTASSGDHNPGNANAKDEYTDMPLLIPVEREDYDTINDKLDEHREDDDDDGPPPLEPADTPPPLSIRIRLLTRAISLHLS
ncbi:hypothetical protein A0H81_08555 [Grifola frondosa]|uniref:Uncharacterized protein n=1 Tax=Grifola frondosa TaxID=5627 RepID=A0A1C7M2U4_GRIFR|nr:hypothetical protein A0H81_08555 [Grifola frondosa]